MPSHRYNELLKPLLGDRENDIEPFSDGDTVEWYRLRSRGTIKRCLPDEGQCIISFEVSDCPKNMKLFPEGKRCFHVGALVEWHGHIGTIEQYLEGDQYVISFEVRFFREDIKLVPKTS